jgi:hypothetical protein
MLFTTAQQRKERLDICMACPVYVAKSSSCGKFMDLFQDLVTIDGVTFKPCGCHLRAKASLKHFDCPAGKWPTIFSKKQLSILKDIAERATKQKFIVKEDRDMLNQIFQTEDPNFRGFSCSSCGSQIFSTLDQLLQDMHNGTVVVDIPPSNPSDIPARIKRSRKKKE